MSGEVGLKAPRAVTLPGVEAQPPQARREQSGVFHFVAGALPALVVEGAAWFDGEQGGWGDVTLSSGSGAAELARAAEVLTPELLGGHRVRRLGVSVVNLSPREAA